MLLPSLPLQLLAVFALWGSRFLAVILSLCFMAWVFAWQLKQFEMYIVFMVNFQTTVVFLVFWNCIVCSVCLFWSRISFIRVAFYHSSRVGGGFSSIFWKGDFCHGGASSRQSRSCIASGPSALSTEIDFVSLCFFHLHFWISHCSFVDILAISA